MAEIGQSGEGTASSAAEVTTPTSHLTKLERLRQEHRAAHARVEELNGRVRLSPDEQAELNRLKKEKLRLKDKIRALMAAAAPAKPN